MIMKGIENLTKKLFEISLVRMLLFCASTTTLKNASKAHVHLFFFARLHAQKSTSTFSSPP